MNSDVIREMLKNVNPAFKVQMSNMTKEYTKNNDDFEPVISVFEDNIDFSFSESADPISVGEFLNQLPKDTIMERDIEDGFVFSPIEFLIIREDIESVILG